MATVSELRRRGIRRVYIAGPMSGLPQFNFPAFDAAALELRELGLDVTSPAELDDPETRRMALSNPDGGPGVGGANGETWGDFLARDVKLLSDGDERGEIDAIVVLEGWEKSRGARLETFVAKRMNGKPILYFHTLEEVPDDVLTSAHAGRSLGFAAQPSALPDGEVRVTNEKTGGQKGKKRAQFSLLPWDQLWQVAELYAAGAEKYDRDNWRKGYDWSLSADSLIRHFTEFWERGNYLDPETGTPHLAAVIFHALALMYFHDHHTELDDRPVNHGGDLERSLFEIDFKRRYT